LSGLAVAVAFTGKSLWALTFKKMIAKESNKPILKIELLLFKGILLNGNYSISIS
jgi:hypothetical protein